MYTLVTKIQPDKFVRWCPDGESLANFCVLYFSVSCVHHVSDLHLKFALRPHHVWKYVDIQSATAEIRRGKRRKKIDSRNHRAKI